MSIKMKLGATAMASTALVTSACSIAEFDALMIVLQDLDYNNSEISALLQGDSVDIAKYFVERKFERSQWRAVTSSVGYKEELMKTYVPVVQKFDAATEDTVANSNVVVVQRTSVNDIVGLANGLAEVGYDERSLEKVTDQPISLDSVRTIEASGLVPELIEGIVSSEHVKTDAIEGEAGKTLLDKYVEFADIVSDGRSEDFVKEGGFDISTISNSVNLLNDLGMTDFAGDDAFDPSAAMAISEYLDGEYNTIKAEVFEELGHTQDSYDRLNDTQKAIVDKAVDEALNGEMADLEDELVATTERLKRKTPTFVFTVNDLATIKATFPAFTTTQQVFDALGANPGDQVTSSDISVAVDLGDLATGVTVDIEDLIKAFFSVSASFKEDGNETAVDITSNIDVDYTVSASFDENNVGTYTIGYSVNENYNGNIDDLKNTGTHLGASKFAYVVVSDVDPAFGDPANSAADDTSAGFVHIDGDDFIIENDILDSNGDYDPNNAIAASLHNIEIWYGSTKIKFGAFENDPAAISAEQIGATVELKFYSYDTIVNAWVREEYDAIDDLEHIIKTAGTYQIRVTFTNQSGDEFLVGGKGVEFTVNTSDIAPPTVRFNDPHLTYNFNGTGGNVSTVASTLTYGFDGLASAATSNVVFFDNISTLDKLQTGTYLLFDATYISKLSAGVQSVCQEMGTYKHKGTGPETNIIVSGFNANDMMCDVSAMGSDFVEENLLMDAQDNYKLVVTAGDENDNWGYGSLDVVLTNTSGIDIDFNGGQGTSTLPFLLDNYQSLYTTDVSRLQESLYDLATVSSNDLKWVEDIKASDPQLFNLKAGESANYTDNIEYTYTVSDTHGNINNGSIFVRFVDTTNPTLSSAPKVLSNTIAPTIKRGTDAMALLNAKLSDNDLSFIGSSGMTITKDHVDSIDFKFVNSNSNQDWTTLTKGTSTNWSTIPSGNWTSSQAKYLGIETNSLAKEMNINDHFALLEITYNVSVSDPSGNIYNETFIIPQVKVYDDSRPVLLSYAGTVNASVLSAGYVTMDGWNLPYSNSNYIRNQMVAMDYDGSVTNLKWNTIGAYWIDTCNSTTPSVSFYWVSQDINRIDNTPDHDSYPQNNFGDSHFWTPYTGSGYDKGSIGNINYDLLYALDNGFVSGNGSYLYQNYNGTGLSLIMVPTFNTGQNHVIQSDVRFNSGQTHWNTYMKTGNQQDHDYFSIQQKVDANSYLGSSTCSYPTYWNDYVIK